MTEKILFKDDRLSQQLIDAYYKKLYLFILRITTIVLLIFLVVIFLWTSIKISPSFGIDISPELYISLGIAFFIFAALAFAVSYDLKNNNRKYGRIVVSDK